MPLQTQLQHPRPLRRGQGSGQPCPGISDRGLEPGKPPARGSHAGRSPCTILLGKLGTCLAMVSGETPPLTMLLQRKRAGSCLSCQEAGNIIYIHQVHMDALELSRSCVITWDAALEPGSPPGLRTLFPLKGRKRKLFSDLSPARGLPSPPAMLPTSLLLHPSPSFTDTHPSGAQLSMEWKAHGPLQAHSRRS